MKEIKTGAVLTIEKTVSEAMLAKEVGSGDVAVYATPMMIAMMEEAASKCLSDFLDEGETSVGIFLSTTHSAATPVGMKVSATAEITEAEGRTVTFSITASDEKDVIGQAQHRRVILQKERFEQKAQEKSNR